MTHCTCLVGQVVCLEAMKEQRWDSHGPGDLYSLDQGNALENH